MIKVGITGGIGSGKSTICSLFSMLGIPVYISDIKAFQLMTGNGAVITALEKTFGKDIYLTDGALNKQKLTKLVFDSPDTRQKINAIVHPAVAKDFQEWSNQQPLSTPYIIQESALLFETGQWKNLDVIITVTCPIQERIERIMKRDNCSEIEAKKKIESQMPVEEKVAQSTFVIESSFKTLVLEKTLHIHNQIIAKQ